MLYGEHSVFFFFNKLSNKFSCSFPPRLGHANSSMSVPIKVQLFTFKVKLKYNIITYVSYFLTLLNLFLINVVLRR